MEARIVVEPAAHAQVIVTGLTQVRVSVTSPVVRAVVPGSIVQMNGSGVFALTIQSGTPDSITCVMPGGIVTYPNSGICIFRPNAANTGPVEMRWGALLPFRDILRPDLSDLQPGDLDPGQDYVLRIMPTHFRIVPSF